MTGRVARWRLVARQRATAGLLAWLRTHRRAELALAGRLLAGRLLAWVWALPTLCLVLGVTGLLLQALGHDRAAWLLVVANVFGIGLYLGTRLTLVALGEALRSAGPRRPGL